MREARASGSASRSGRTGASRATAPPRVRAFGACLCVALAAMGWSASGALLAGAFGAFWLPEGPAMPASSILSGVTITLDPGHGGFDPGVRLDDGGSEADINLAIALKLRAILETAGAAVVMTRTDDSDVLDPGPEGVARLRHTLRKRVAIATEAGSDILLSLHCNSFPQGVWRGAQAFYMDEAHPGGKALAEAIQGELVRVTRETDRTPNGRVELYLCKNMDAPTVIVELGFLSNPRDLSLLRSQDYQHLIAMAVFFGICRFVELGRLTGPS